MVIIKERTREPVCWFKLFRKALNSRGGYMWVRSCLIVRESDRILYDVSAALNAMKLTHVYWSQLLHPSNSAEKVPHAGSTLMYGAQCVEEVQCIGGIDVKAQCEGITRQRPEGDVKTTLGGFKGLSRL
jgi:hypothetical protein